MPSPEMQKVIAKIINSKCSSLPVLSGLLQNQAIVSRRETACRSPCSSLGRIAQKASIEAGDCAIDPQASGLCLNI